MRTKNIAQMTREIDAHYAADLLIQGTYCDSETGQACFIGCVAEGVDSPAFIESEYGIPASLTRALEFVFEKLPQRLAGEFFEAIPRAIGEDGKDLTRVVYAFAAETLRALPWQADCAHDVIAPVITGMDLLAAGQPWAAPTALRADVHGLTKMHVVEGITRTRGCAAAAAQYALNFGGDGAERWAARVAESAREGWNLVSSRNQSEGPFEIRRQSNSLLRLMRDAPK